MAPTKPMRSRPAEPSATCRASSCRLLRIAQQRVRRSLQRLPGGRQAHRLAVALEQLRADRRLELADRHAQRRLRDRQTPRGPAEVQFFGQNDEIAQVAQLHEGTLQR
jgi:hypothetical protein